MNRTHDEIIKDERFVVTTFRIPKEVHEQMKKYIEDYNHEVRWWDKKMSMTVLTGKALTEYMEAHKNIKQEVAH